MRYLRQPAVRALIASTIVSVLPFVSANPFSRPDSPSPTSPLLATTTAYELANSLEIRDCPAAQKCGWQGQLCCGANQYCYTDANDEAQCGDTAAAGGAGWQLYTTVYVVSQVETVTTVWSEPIAAATPNVVTVTVAAPASGGGSAQVCNYQLGQVQCGLICCAQGQFCNAGVCVNNGGTTPAAGGGVATITAAVRPTSISTYTVITTGGVTTTVPYLAPATATGGTVSEQSTGSHLSGGAIAGIVIGVLAGIVILILLIVCCCAKGLLDLIRPKRKTEVTEVYESRHHESGSAAGPPRRRFPFFGIGGGGNNAAAERQKKEREWLGVAGVLAAIAVILGLRRRRERREEEKESTAYTYSDYTYSYSGTSASSASSDRRSRGTRHTRSDMRSSRR